MKRFFIAIFAAAAIGGCTTSVVVHKVEGGTPESRVGIPHPLLFSRYDAKLRWQVTQCGASMKLKIGAEFKDPIALPDSDNLFVIDPSSLSSPLKTAELSVEYLPSGAPAALNAKIEDRTAQVIAGLASLGAALVQFRTVPTPADAIPGAAVQQVCTKEVIASLRKMEGANKAVAASSALVERRTADLKLITDKLAALGINADEATKAAAAKAIDALGQAIAMLSDGLKAQGKLLESISYEETIAWPPSGNVTQGKFEIPSHVLKRWTMDAASEKTRSAASVYVSLEGRDKAGVIPSSAGPVRPELGIPIRIGADGQVFVCVGNRCDAGGEFVMRRNDRLMQLGGVYYLPCISRPFSSVSCSYAADENGRLKKMGSILSNAQAETALASITDVVKQATEARQARREARTKQLEVETAYLKAKAERDTADAALAKDPLQGDKDATAALKAHAERLDGERALIEAELALADARARASKP